jgi:hypothetical protein
MWLTSMSWLLSDTEADPRSTPNGCVAKKCQPWEETAHASCWAANASIPEQIGTRGAFC